MKNKWFIVSLVVILGVLVASVITKGFGAEKIFRQPANKIAMEAIDYINKNVLTGNTTATLVSSAWLDNDLIKFALEIDGKNFDSYISSDGKFLFPDVFNMKETEEEKKEKEKKAEAEEKSKLISIEFPKTEKPDVKLFVMSFCPYGNQAEDSMKPVMELLGEKVNISLNYVIYDNYAKSMNAKPEEYCLSADEKYCSMHGRGELNQDIRELCVAKYQKDKFWQFVDEINKGASADNVETKWQAIAKNLNINVSKIKTCQKNEAEKLLEQEVVLNNKYQAQGSPTLVINDTTYQSGISSESYKQAICSAFINPPEECKIMISTTENEAQGSCN